MAWRFSQGAEQEFHSHLVLVNVNTLETREIPDPSPRCEATGLAAFSPDGKSMQWHACTTSG